MKTTYLILLLACALAAAPAFGSGGDESGAGATGEMAGPEEPQYGGILTMKFDWASEGPPGNWDAMRVGYVTRVWGAPYMEKLLIGDIETYGPRGTGEYEFTGSMWHTPEEYLAGQLAESWTWTEPLTLSFAIRRGVMWTGNANIGFESREFTAADAARSLTRSVDIAREDGWGSPTYDYIDAFVATDTHTLVVEMNAFNPGWAQDFGYGFLAQMYAPEVLDADHTVWQNQSGTGPFILTDYAAGSQATYTRNPNYWGTTTVDGKEYQMPFIDKLIFPVIPDQSTQLALLRTGKLDWHQYIPLRYSETLSKTSPELIQQRYLTTLGGALGMKMTQEPFGDLNVRRALMIGLDLESIASSIYGGAEVFAYPYKPGTPPFTPLEELSPPIQELYTYDPEKAQRILAEAGYPDGFAMKVYSEAGNVEHQDTLAMVKAMWADIGVEVEIIPVELVGLLARLHGHEYEDSLYYIYHGGGGGVSDPSLIEFSWVKNYAEWDYGKSVDGSWYEDQYHKAVASRDAAERTAILQELGTYKHEALPYIPFPVPYLINAYWPWVRNYYGEINGARANYTPMIARLWIDQELKQELGY